MKDQRECPDCRELLVGECQCESVEKADRALDPGGPLARSYPEVTPEYCRDLRRRMTEASEAIRRHRKRKRAPRCPYCAHPIGSLVFAFLALIALASPVAASPLCETASAAHICETAIRMDYGTTATPRPKLAIETCNRVAKSAQAFGVRPSLAVAISSAESTFRPWAVSHAGAVGAMQVKPHYHCPKRFGVRFCLSSRELIDSGVRHLADLLETLDERTALRSYNAGRRGARLGRGERYAATVARIERRIR